MIAKLQRFLEEDHRILLKKQVQELFLYMAFALRFCQKFKIDFKECNDLVGLLPRLFQRISAYEIKEAAFAFDSYIPWHILQHEPKMRDDIHNLFYELYKTENCTSEWLFNTVNEILEDSILTHKLVRTLIAELASQNKVHEIVDLCCGTFLLGLEVWNRMGKNDNIECYGEEINLYLCSISRLLLFYAM